jgi:hypothetical protein
MWEDWADRTASWAGMWWSVGREGKSRAINGSDYGIDKIAGALGRDLGGDVLGSTHRGVSIGEAV